MSQYALVRPSKMNFGEWLVVDTPPEKLFRLEAQCRSLENSTEAGKLAALLLKQNFKQQELLQSALHEIARLELLLMHNHHAA